MDTIIRSMSDLTTIIESRVIKAMEATRDKIFETIFKKVDDYYEEPVFSLPDETEPDFYVRTGRLLESLTAGHVIKSGNNYEFTVGWDRDYLTFRYPSRFTKSGYNGSYNKATGLQILNWFNSESHGGTVPGSHKYFDEAIFELGGKEGIIKILKKNFKKYGIPVE